MPTTMHVEPESMQSAGDALTRAAQEMASGLAGLRGTIQGDGNPWGGDEPGTVFGQLYTAVLGQAFESIVSHVEQVAYAGSALARQADGYRQVETATTGRFRAMAG